MRLIAGLTRPSPTDGAAIRFGTQTLSGEQVLAAATAVADEVAGAQVVAVHATATAETVVAMIGALLGGAAVVPLPPDSGETETAHILNDSGAQVLLAHGEHPPTSVRTVPIDLRRTSATTYPAPPPEATALIMYTSGTTGAPKGAVLSHRAVEAGLDALAEAWAWHPDDLLVHGLPLFHVHGLVLGVFGALRVGNRLHHTVRPAPQAYAEAGGSLYFGVPTVWSRMCARPDLAARLAKARLLVSGSAALPVPVFERMRELTGHRPVERYGMTETLITVSNRADDPDRRPGQVGTPVAGVATRVVDEDRDVPADGESIGELWVRGPMLFDGYLHRPAATGWFRTGDIASVAPDGRHRIVGRRSTDLIKSGGYRIGAGEVEDALLAHPGVREAAVIGTPHDDLGEQVTAYVVGDAVSADELIGFVARTLSAHKRPREIRFVAELPRNAMGKVQKRLLAR
ncbi:acyl-CoA synthetase [Actinoplanes friuliensis]|uniref:Acyl-CoA synthetase n=1 Tax=Actinoplanes friuliensis DSM 7358 TaxID=1246995 RepID=U5W3Z9_9ACTN|nr:acyl-CoA synthetase [Actinoplanes friuliensis]AGZ43859.1 acyl-CoA synthetase [Actinoplanes friuliensis DSM 7358]